MTPLHTVTRKLNDYEPKCILMILNLKNAAYLPRLDPLVHASAEILPYKIFFKVGHVHHVFIKTSMFKTFT